MCASTSLGIGIIQLIVLKKTRSNLSKHPDTVIVSFKIFKSG